MKGLIANFIRKKLEEVKPPDQPIEQVILPSISHEDYTALKQAVDDFYPEEAPKRMSAPPTPPAIAEHFDAPVDKVMPKNRKH